MRIFIIGISVVSVLLMASAATAQRADISNAEQEAFQKQAQEAAAAKERMIANETDEQRRQRLDTEYKARGCTSYHLAFDLDASPIPTANDQELVRIDHEREKRAVEAAGAKAIPDFEKKQAQKWWFRMRELYKCGPKHSSSSTMACQGEYWFCPPRNDQ